MNGKRLTPELKKECIKNNLRFFALLKVEPISWRFKTKKQKGKDSG